MDKKEIYIKISVIPDATIKNCEVCGEETKYETGIRFMMRSIDSGKMIIESAGLCEGCARSVLDEVRIAQEIIYDIYEAIKEEKG